MTILFEDTVHPETGMPFWKLQFNINYKTAIFVACAHGCCVYCFLFFNVIALHNNHQIISLLLTSACQSIRKSDTLSSRRVLLIGVKFRGRHIRSDVDPFFFYTVLACVCVCVCVCLPCMHA